MRWQRLGAQGSDGKLTDGDGRRAAVRLARRHVRADREAGDGWEGRS